MRYIRLFLITQTLLYSQSSNIHAFLPKTNALNMSFSLEKVNDTVDIFNVKDSEIKKKSSLGDMKGVNFNFGYALSDKWYFNLNLNQKSLNYSAYTLTNREIEFYSRYMLYRYDNIAFSMDFGYIGNRANNIFMDTLESINDVLEDVTPNREIELKEINSQQVLFYRGEDGSVKTISLENRAFVSIKDTYDNSFYTRAILSLKKEAWLFDTYVGYKESKVHNKIDSSFSNEKNPDLEKELKQITLVQNRTDKMWFVGLGTGYTLDKVQLEVNYRYNYINRIKSLNKVKDNHILNLNINYNINKNLKCFIGGKIMFHQFNGEIPYLYTVYNQGSFARKHGFADIGISYEF